MKNKYYFLIAIIAVVIIVESLMLLSKEQGISKVVVENKVTPSVEVVKEVGDLSFSWREGDKAVLLMTANRDMSLDAVDLYIDYQGVDIKAVNSNGGVLPSPTFKRISPEKSLVVLNYLIDTPDGLKLLKGQTIEVLDLEINQKSGQKYQLSIDEKTQVVENGSSKVLPFNSQNLIINGSL